MSRTIVKVQIGTTGAGEDRILLGPNVAPITYSASMTPNVPDGPVQRIIVTNGVAMTINAPTGPSDADVLTLIVQNSSGGVMGAVTFNAAFLPAGAFVVPLSTKRRTIQFVYEASTALWLEVNRAAADI